MASEWIKWIVGLTRKPEVVTLSSRFKRDRFSIAARLMCVWEWADTVTDDGRVRGVNIAFIDELAELEEFGVGMVDVGWLSQTNDGIEFINYVENNGATGKSRAIAQKRQQRSRSKRDKSVTESVTRVEKSREDIRQTDTRAREGEPADESQSARTSILDRFARLLNKPSTQINWGPVVTWLATVEQDGQLALASECLDHALQTSTSTPQTTQGAVKYVAAIYERCRQHDCKPGEFKPPDTGSPLAAKAKSVLDEIFNGSTK